MVDDSSETEWLDWQNSLFTTRDTTPEPKIDNKHPPNSATHSFYTKSIRKCNNCPDRDSCPDFINDRLCAEEVKLHNRAMKHFLKHFELGPEDSFALERLIINILRVHRGEKAIAKDGDMTVEDIFDNQGNIVGRRFIQHPLFKEISKLDSKIRDWMNSLALTRDKRKGQTVNVKMDLLSMLSELKKTRDLELQKTMTTTHPDGTVTVEQQTAKVTEEVQAKESEPEKTKPEVMTVTVEEEPQLTTKDSKELKKKALVEEELNG
jgi:hypothetical protein